VAGHFPLTLVTGARRGGGNSIASWSSPAWRSDDVHVAGNSRPIYVLIAKQHTGEEASALATDLALDEPAPHEQENAGEVGLLFLNQPSALTRGARSPAEEYS